MQAGSCRVPGVLCRMSAADTPRHVMRLQLSCGLAVLDVPAACSSLSTASVLLVVGSNAAPLP